MDKTPEHIELDRKVEDAQKAIRMARNVLQEALKARRVYRAAHRQGASTRISSSLLERVQLTLSVHQRKNVPTIAREIGVSEPAVRVAVLRLLREGKARRIGFQGQRWWVYAVEEQREAAE